MNENGALDSSQKVLIDTYATVQLADGTAVNQVLSFADHVAWAGHAALYRSALAVDGTATKIDENDVVPEIPVKWGRLSYLNTTVNDTGPIETFPATGPGGSGDDVIAYFQDFFNLTERQVVTLMGVHTFGGARRSASGYAGMWTQSKNKFNTDYQLQLVFPLPLFCPTPSTCEYFSDAGENKSSLDPSNLADMKTCRADNLPEDADRCNGWEQVTMAGVDGASAKFQWRHSCHHYNADGDNKTETVEGCTHMMLNVDMGLYRDLDGHICTAEDENITLATLNRTCKVGMIKSYADPTCESNKSTQRVLATCFNLRSSSSTFLEEDAADHEGWIQAFAPLFDMLLSYNLTGTPTLETLTPPSESPSEAPSAAPTVCEDLSRWQFYWTDQNGNNVTKRCIKIENMLLNGDTTACNRIGINGTVASEACPKTCGTCGTSTNPGASAAPTGIASEAPSEAPTVCEDLSRWQFYWIDQNGNNVTKRCIKIENMLLNGDTTACNRIGINGTLASESCRKTCGTCNA